MEEPIICPRVSPASYQLLTLISWWKKVNYFSVDTLTARRRGRRSENFIRMELLSRYTMKHTAALNASEDTYTQQYTFVYTRLEFFSRVSYDNLYLLVGALEGLDEQLPNDIHAISQLVAKDTGYHSAMSANKIKLRWQYMCNRIYAYCRPCGHCI